MAEKCSNVEWARENEAAVKWARTMWWCDCPLCEMPVEARGARRG